MRSNIVTEAGLPTRINQWWGSIPFITSGVVIVCSVIYLICLLFGYDSFYEICFLPSQIVSHFQVYRFYTSVLFHGSLLHVVFNMLAFVPLGSELERIMGSVRLLYLIILLSTTNAIAHLIVALLVDHNPIHPYAYFMNECSIGFSGVIFSLIVIETSLSGAQSRSVFGLFNVPSKLYPWILLVLFQLLASNVSFLGHMCGILSGFAYTFGLFNYLLPPPSFYASIESSSTLSFCIRRPRFILCTGGTTYGQLPTYSSGTGTTQPRSLLPDNLWRNMSSWIPQRGTSVVQEGQDPRFPGRGRTLGSARNQSSTTDSDSNLQERLLDDTAPTHAPTDLRDVRNPTVNTVEVDGSVLTNQGSDSFEEELKKLVAMGFEKTQAEVALAAADGEPSVAIEILMSQQVNNDLIS
ncbi:Rhomboid family protein [Rhynchospora pubera]|uniref:Rhomboid family protein n=1 Tax=Rhynchospora pubera TaxID=906938 RepID=A0AAV8F886_9POAL|nr:Rhomboid family protein [Rhynchospora pubera]